MISIAAQSRTSLDGLGEAPKDNPGVVVYVNGESRKSYMKVESSGVLIGMVECQQLQIVRILWEGRIMI